MQTSDRAARYHETRRFQLIAIEETRPTLWTQARDLWTGTPWLFKVGALIAAALQGGPALAGLL